MYSDIYFIFLSVGLLSVVILFHELGHFLVGRMCGIGVSTFSVGFGRPIFSFFDGNGTKWQFSWILIGGYVKFSKDKSRCLNRVSFEEAALFKRFLTVLAGPFASLLFSFLVFIPIFLLSGMSSNEPLIGEISNTPKEIPILSGDRILEINGKKVNSFSDIYKLADKNHGKNLVKISRNEKVEVVEIETFFPPIVESVEFMSPAEQAGILPGDFISSVNGIEIFNFSQLQDIISESENRQIKLDVIRNGGVLSFLLEKEYLVTQDKNGNLEELLRIGVSGTILLKPQIVSRPLLGSIFDSFRAVIYVVRLTLSSIANMITNKIGVEQISGPVGITYVIGETTKFGLIPTLGLIGMISASIGVLNLLPIPMLDGGHLLSYLLEIILGRRIVNKLNKPMTVLGFAIIATLFSIGFLNDIDKIFL